MYDNVYNRLYSVTKYDKIFSFLRRLIFETVNQRGTWPASAGQVPAAGWLLHSPIQFSPFPIFETNLYNSMIHGFPCDSLAAMRRLSPCS